MNNQHIQRSKRDFPARVDQPLRYADTDRQGHINNAVFSTLFECGRVDFLYDPNRPLSAEGSQFVIAEITMRFIDEMHWPNTVTVGTGVTRLGRSSFNLTQCLFCEDQCVASADSVMVLMDETTRKSTALSESTRAALEGLMCPQEHSS